MMSKSFLGQNHNYKDIPNEKRSVNKVADLFRL